MAWPKGRPRPRKVGSTLEGENAPSPEVDESASVAQEQTLSDEPGETAQGIQTPSGWRKGALLNVRNHGDAYVITLWPEELDPQHPERSMRFTNLGECQDFVSHWYAREAHDPRAR